MRVAIIEKEADMAKKKPTSRDLVQGKFSKKAKKARDEFFRHKREHPEPKKDEELTPIQEKMQSGGP